ncbi:MAG: chromophore lyase CpcT/CpeT [Ignavibacteria bacterium]|jgi:CpeT protein
MNIHLIIALFSIFFIGCASTNTQTNSSKDPALQEFARMLIGEFSSKEQSLQDTTYLNIHLSMSRIWDEDKSAIWLYVEQAMDAKREKPYRQRVYKLNHPRKDIFTSEIYTLKNQERFIGLQNDPTKRTMITPDMIELKDGCTVTMNKSIGIYIGGTDADKCPSDLRGASYATTKIILKENMLESWDQGFDKNGVQVWGATKGGYIFMREK